MRAPICRVCVLTVWLVACGGETTEPEGCEGDDCFCATPADCPGMLGCLEDACYAEGEVPRSGQCSEDADCEDGVCEVGNETTPAEDWYCTSACTGSTNVGCPEGWACYQTGNCLPENSLPTGSRCVNSLLCPVDDICANSTCLTPCVMGYSPLGCAAGQYCYVSSPPHCRDGSECVLGTNEFCAPPDICIDLGADVRECRLPCTYSVTGATYSDDCADEVLGSFATTCAPMGVDEAAVCIEVGEKEPGEGCNWGTRRCQRGSICVDGACRQLCTAQVSCASGTCTVVASGFRACL